MEKQKSPVQRALELYAEHVGRSPRDHLVWALKRVDASGKFTPGERADLVWEIAVFCQVRSNVPGYGAVTGTIDNIDKPTDKEIEAILDSFVEMIGQAIRREPIALGAMTVQERLCWFKYPKGSLARGKKLLSAKNRDRYTLDSHLLTVPLPRRVKKGGRWVPGLAPAPSVWAQLARRALGRAIEEAGHLLKECPAPLPRGQAGEICEKWFVATRPNQDYCSPECKRRATMRASRKGEKTAAVQKRHSEEAQWSNDS